MSRASKVTDTAGLDSCFRSWSDQSAVSKIRQTPSVALSGELLPPLALTQCCLVDRMFNMPENSICSDDESSSDGSNDIEEDYWKTYHPSSDRFPGNRPNWLQY
jgi:hypothetical protein